MNKPLLMTAAALGCAVLLSGCAVSADTAANTAPVQTTGSLESDLAPAAVLAENADATTLNDDEWNAADARDVVFDETGVASEVPGVTANAGTVTIAAAGVYRLSGSLTGGVVVDAPDDAQVVLMLDGVQIANDSGSAISVLSADDVGLFLVAGTQNSVSDASQYADDAQSNAAIWADTDLTISGTGALSVTANGNDGVTSRNDLVVLGGDLTVVAADDALRGKKALVVEGGSLDLTAIAGDGMKADEDDDWTEGYISVTGGRIDITAGDDGMQASTDVVVTGGELSLAVADDGIKGRVIVSIGADANETEPTVTVSESYEGIEAANIGIFAGTVSVTAEDDGINASGNGELQALLNGTEYVAGDREADSGERLEIHGGEVTVVAGVDGLDSNGTITITGGTVNITSAERGGDSPIDANGTVEVAEGVVTANGSAWDAAAAAGMGGPGGMGGPAGQDGPGGQGGFGGEMPEGFDPSQMPAPPSRSSESSSDTSHA